MKRPLPQFLAEKAEILKRAGIEQATSEIELILCHLLQTDRLGLFLDGADRINDDIEARLDSVLNRRATRYPLQYILGESWFYGRRFLVTPAVMVPTPETELLCEAALKQVALRRLDVPRILDVGTGSGVIAVTMACELPNCHVVGLDVSPDALAVARQNAESLDVASRIEFRQSDFFAAVDDSERFDLILSNPPYICEGDYAGLPPEVLADPRLALVSGVDGLDAIRMILKDAPRLLKQGGRIMFEIGYDQSELVSRLTEADRQYTSIAILKDLNDIDRVVILGCD